MATGKWRDPQLRNIQRKGRSYYLRVQNDSEVVEATGRKFTVHHLGPDLALAIRRADAIRCGKQLDQLTAELTGIPRQDDAPAYLQDAPSDLKDEREAFRWYRRATRTDRKLRDLADRDKDVLALNTMKARHGAIKRSGLVWLSDVPDRRAAQSVVDRLLRDHNRTTVANTLRVLKTLWHEAERMDIVAENVFSNITVKTLKTKKRPLTVPEVHQVLSGSEGFVHDAIFSLVCTGARAQELLKADLKDNLLTIKNSKTETSSRSLVLPTEVAESVHKGSCREALILISPQPDTSAVLALRHGECRCALSKALFRDDLPE